MACLGSPGTTPPTRPIHKLQTDMRAFQTTSTSLISGRNPAYINLHPPDSQYEADINMQYTSTQYIYIHVCNYGLHNQSHLQTPSLPLVSAPRRWPCDAAPLPKGRRRGQADGPDRAISHLKPSPYRISGVHLEILDVQCVSIEYIE